MQLAVRAAGQPADKQEEEQRGQSGGHQDHSSGGRRVFRRLKEHVPRPSIPAAVSVYLGSISLMSAWLARQGKTYVPVYCTLDERGGLELSLYLQHTMCAMTPMPALHTGGISAFSPSQTDVALRHDAAAARRAQTAAALRAFTIPEIQIRSSPTSQLAGTGALPYWCNKKDNVNCLPDGGMVDAVDVDSAAKAISLACTSKKATAPPRR